MCESEDENENFCFFGKPLDPYDEDSIPRKRPISVEEQIATDAQGRRRFHGAFTGGFSAGFFNTVGSLEGWTPSEFKSSRLEKSKGFTQKPQDFMDEEDLGEDGIAPQVVRATSDYNTSRKRKKQVFSDGPVPGEPVLHNILTSGNETVGYMLLKNLRLRDKIKQRSEVIQEKIYSCEMPKEDDNIFPQSEDNQYEIPEIYKEYLAKPKSNIFGLGYSGLNKDHFSLFPSQKDSKLVVTDRNNKKLSITGQAFGVGAFENDDDDIYMKDDMSKYDFELFAEKEKEKPKKDVNKLILDLFLPSKTKQNKTIYPPPTIPHSFTGKHKVRRSRFEQIDPPETPSTSKINPIIRAKYLGEESDKEYTASKSFKKEDSPKVEKESSKQCSSQNSQSDVSSYLSDRFVSSSKIEDVSNILESVEKAEVIHGTEQMRDAVKMKMFGPLTRITSDWVPCALLCKRFNVPEPFVDRPEKSRTRTKNIIFEYQKHLEEENLQPGLKKEPHESESVPEESIQPENTAEIKEETEKLAEIKTETEESVDSRPKDIADRLDLEQQQDLFKAIFLSSDSESEKEEEIKQKEKVPKQSDNEIRKEEMKSVILSDQLIPKIKPIKEGVLSGINFHKFAKPEPKPDDKTAVEVSKEPDCYGPKIPGKIPEQIGLAVSALSSESDEEWVEKDSSDIKKQKKHKKSKKHKKDKHKKHKLGKKKYKD